VGSHHLGVLPRVARRRWHDWLPEVAVMLLWVWRQLLRAAGLGAAWEWGVMAWLGQKGGGQVFMVSYVTERRT